MPGVDSALERLNYLDEFQDPRSEFEESDFWLEPNESSGVPSAHLVEAGRIRLQGFLPRPGNRAGRGRVLAVTKFFYLEEPKGTQEMNR